VKLSMWPQDDSHKLPSEIQALRGQKVAAAQLLDEIEKEAEQIDQRLQEKARQSKLQPKKGLLGIPGLSCTSCGPSLDTEEINLGLPSIVKDDIIELRPVLRNHIKECQQTLAERDSEVRRLKHELELLRCAETTHQDHKETLLDGSRNTKQQLLQRYGAAFGLVEGSFLQVSFFSWKCYVQQRAMRDRMLKRVGLALANDSAQRKALVFASWHSLAHDKRQARRSVQEKRRQALAQNYAAKFAMNSDSGMLRAVVIEWWRVSKESVLQTRLAEVHAERRAAVTDASASKPLVAAQQNQPRAADKACCTLM